QPSSQQYRHTGEALTNKPPARQATFRSTAVPAVNEDWPRCAQLNERTNGEFIFRDVHGRCRMRPFKVSSVSGVEELDVGHVINVWMLANRCLFEGVRQDKWLGFDIAT